MNQTTPGRSSACGSRQETWRISTVATGAEDVLITAWLTRAPAKPRWLLLPHGRCSCSRAAIRSLMEGEDITASATGVAPVIPATRGLGARVTGPRLLRGCGASGALSIGLRRAKRNCGGSCVVDRGAAGTGSGLSIFRRGPQLTMLLGRRRCRTSAHSRVEQLIPLSTFSQTRSGATSEGARSLRGAHGAGLR
jgi:hypothetical protein